MNKPISELKKRLMLNYLLSVVFGQSDSLEEMKKIDETPEEEILSPKTEVRRLLDSKPEMPKFKALKNKLEKAQDVPNLEPEVRGEDAETGRIE